MAFGDDHERRAEAEAALSALLTDLDQLPPEVQEAVQKLAQSLLPSTAGVGAPLSTLQGSADSLPPALRQHIGTLSSFFTPEAVIEEDLESAQSSERPLAAVGQTLDQFRASHAPTKMSAADAEGIDAILDENRQLHLQLKAKDDKLRELLQKLQEMSHGVTALQAEIERSSAAPSVDAEHPVIDMEKAMPFFKSRGIAQEEVEKFIVLPGEQSAEKRAAYLSKLKALREMASTAIDSAQSEDLSHEMRGLQDSIADLEHFKASFDSSAIALDKLLRNKAALQQALELKDLAMLRMKRAGQQHLVTISELEIMLAAHIERGMALAADLNVHTVHVSALMTYKALLEDELAEMAANLELKERRIAAIEDQSLSVSELLQMDLEDTKRDLAKAKADLMEKTAALTDAEKKLSADGASLKKMKVALSTKERALKSLEEKSQALEGKCGDLQKRLDRADGKIRDLTTSLASSEERGEGAKQRLRKIESSSQQWQSTVDGMQADIDRLTKENLDLKSLRSAIDEEMKSAASKAQVVQQEHSTLLEQNAQLQKTTEEQDRLSDAVAEDIKELAEVVSQSSVGDMKLDSKGFRIALKCQSLIKFDWLSMVDPCVALYLREDRESAWVYHSKTDSIRNDRNPVFRGDIFLPSEHETSEIKLVVFDTDSDQSMTKMAESRVLGEAKINLSAILKKVRKTETYALSNPGSTKLDRRLKRAGSKLIVDVTEMSSKKGASVSGDSRQNLGDARQNLMQLRSGLLSLLSQQESRERALLEERQDLEDQKRNMLQNNAGQLREKEDEVDRLTRELDDLKDVKTKLKQSQAALRVKDLTLAAKASIITGLQDERKKLLEQVETVQRQSSAVSRPTQGGEQLKMHVDKYMALLERVGAPVQRPIADARKVGQTGFETSRLELLNSTLSLFLNKLAPRELIPRSTGQQAFDSAPEPLTLFEF
jgi:DNA repair exonuclease SbcCD ATPase subunit